MSTETGLRWRLCEMIDPVNAAVYARALFNGDTRGDPGIIRPAMSLLRGGGLGGIPGLSIRIDDDNPVNEYFDPLQHLDHFSPTVDMGLQLKMQKEMRDKYVDMYHPRRLRSYVALSSHKRHGASVHRTTIRPHRVLVSRSQKYVTKLFIPDTDHDLGAGVKKKVFNEVRMQFLGRRIATRRIQIPEIVQWGICEVENRKGMFIRMKYVHGKSIGAFDCVPIDVYAALGTFVATLGKLGIRHGDLHRHNIVYDPDTDSIWILDWGEAEETTSPQGWEKLFSLPPICPPNQLYFSQAEDNHHLCKHCWKGHEEHASTEACTSFMLSSSIS